MLLKIVKVAIIMGSTSLCTLLSNVLIARALDKQDMGIFSLIVSLIAFFTSISLLGRSNALARYFSKYSLNAHNWKKELMKIFPLSLFMIFILAICSRYIYHLSTFYISVAITSSLVFVYIELISGGIIRSQRKYNLAMFTQKGFIFVFVILLLVLKKVDLLTLHHLLLLYGFSLVLFGFLNFGLVSSTFTNGPLTISRELRSDSLLFWGINISLIAISSLDKFFIVKLISYSDLAIYVSVLTITGLYELCSMSLGYVLLPHFGRMKRIKLKTYILQGSLIAAMVSGLYLVWGKQLVHLVYSGKYDEGIPFLHFFVLAGVCKILYAIPSSVIGGRLEKKALQLTFYYSAINVLLHVGFLFWFITAWGLKGAAMAMCAIWFLRTLQGYFILYQNRHVLRLQDEVATGYSPTSLVPEKIITSP